MQKKIHYNPLVGFSFLVGTYLYTPILWAEQSIAEFLSGPEVYKIDWNTRAMSSHDIDNNGAHDLLLINNEQTRIEILYQNREDLKQQQKKQQRIWQPILEDTRFSHRNIVTGVKMNALAAADLNGDGLTDIVYTSNTFGLSLLYQKPADKWSEAIHIDYVQPSKNSSSLRLADINSDSKKDIILLGEKQLLIFYQDNNGQYQIPHRYPFVDNNHFSLQIHDSNADKRPDILYLAKNSRFALRLRTQNEDGSFGPEQTFPIDTPRHEFSLLSAEKNQLAYIENKTNQLIVGHFKQQKSSTNQLSVPQVYPLPFKEIGAANYSTGDINGDHRIDIIAADFKGAQVWLYQQLNHGKFSKPIAFPSFSGIQSVTLADLDQDQIDELYVASKSEKLVGVSRFIENKQLTYPKPFFDLANKNHSGTPIALGQVSIGADKTPALVVLTKQKKERNVGIYIYDKGQKKLLTRQTIGLKNLKLDPNGIKSIDINQDGLADLIFFVLHKPAIILLQSSDGNFTQLENQNFRQGLLDNLKPGSLTTGDINADQVEELLVAGKGYARAMRSNKQQQLEIIEQYNAVNKTAPITSILPINIDQDADKEILIYQQRSEKIDILKKDENNVYRPLNSLISGQLDIVDSMVLKPTDRPQRLLYLGKDRFWILPVNEEKTVFEILSRHESNLPEVSYQKLASGDMNHDNVADILALDAQSTHIVELLSRKGSHWKNLYHFEVFDAQSVSSDSRGGHSEPREVILSDINKDKKNDIIFLVHDRILIYFGN